MAGTKQKSLTKIDNNYQINLRYPDINDFLKDTFFSLQNNQSIERTLLANPRVELSTARNVHTIVVAGYSIQVSLSDFVIYGFSPDQEIIYDFLVAPEILGEVLTDFNADRTTEDALLQSVQSASLYNLESAANFNIKVTSKKVADLLSELFTIHADKIKSELELADDAALLDYVLNNLFSLSFTFICSYRLQPDSDYLAGFRVPVALSYLVPSLFNQTAIKLAKIDAVVYNPNASQSPPQLLFKGIYNLTGQLQLTQTSDSNKYVDSVKIAVTKSESPQEFKSGFRTADYVWRTISGVDNTPPAITYNYTFAVQNAATNYAGAFAVFQSPATTNGALTLKVSNYAVQIKKYKDSSTNTDKYNASVSFDLVNSSSKQTALSTLFTKVGSVTSAPNLFMQADFLNSADKTRATAPSATFERFVVLTTLNNNKPYTTDAGTQTTLSGCFLYTSANTNADRSQFSKTTQRVVSTYSGVPNFASKNIGVISPTVNLLVSSAIPKGKLGVGLLWSSLNANELAALHQLTTASGIQVSLLDSFMNVVAVTDSLYVTNNKLTRSESPLVNSSFVYTAEVDYTKTTLNVAGTSISGLLTSSQRAVGSSLRVLSGPKIAAVQLIDYTAPEFNLRENIYCVATWDEVGANKIPIKKWSSVLHQPAQSQIDITATDITVSVSQKASMAVSLFANVSKPPKVYSIYVLLPWSIVRDVGVKKSIVRSSLVSGKYTYAYAIKV